MAKDLYFDVGARSKLLKGMKQVADAVKVTLGPCGRNVMFEKNGNVIVTKDGVTVAKEVELEDNAEKLGADLLKQVAAKTNEVAGDNTTTSTVLAYALIREGMKAIAAGMDPVEIKRGIDAATLAVSSNLVNSSKPVGTEEIISVATISANNDPEIGKILAEAIGKVGKDGVVTVEESNNVSTTVEVVNGMQLSKGYLNPNMCNDRERMEVNYPESYILVTDKEISSMNLLMGILDPIARSGKALTIICEKMEGEALGTIILNDIRGSLKVNVVEAPSFGDNKKNILKDVCALTGATFISDDNGNTLETLSMEKLGFAKVKSNKNETVITGVKKTDSLQARVKELETQIENTENSYDKNKLKARLARLTNGVALVKVGAITDVELKEKKYRVEDTIAATRAALEAGIVAGGGVALLNASMGISIDSSSNDFDRGVQIVLDACAEPLKQIAENAGKNGEVVLNKIYEHGGDGYGYNAAKDEYVDMLSHGIIDTTKAIKSALENAASVAGMVLTTECVIAEKPKKEQPPMIASPIGPMPM